MPANSEKIVFCVKLPNHLYYKLHEVSRYLGETKATFCRRVLLIALDRETIKNNIPKK